VGGRTGGVSHTNGFSGPSASKTGEKKKEKGLAWGLWDTGVRAWELETRKGPRRREKALRSDRAKGRLDRKKSKRKFPEKKIKSFTADRPAGIAPPAAVAERELKK